MAQNEKQVNANRSVERRWWIIDDGFAQSANDNGLQRQDRSIIQESEMSSEDDPSTLECFYD